jgi:FeS assembly SUF system protein
MWEWLRGRRERRFRDAQDDERDQEREEESLMKDVYEMDQTAEVLDLTHEGRGASMASSGPGVDSSAVSSVNASSGSTVGPSATSHDSSPGQGLSPAMQIRDRVISVLKTVYDPEIPVDIYELGLVYGVDVTDDGEVHITMTLTSPMCPVAETLPPEVEEKAREVIGVKDVVLDLVWDPPWSMDMMSDSARLELNLM